MEIERLIANMPPPPLPRGLRSAILSRIRAAAERTRKIQQTLFGGLSLISAILLYPAALAIEAELSSSAFAPYLSLLSTDGGAVLAHWREFLLSLAGSAPVTGAVFALGASAALLLSLRAFAHTLPPAAQRAVS